jgi:hypothetical protein
MWLCILKDKNKIDNVASFKMDKLKGEYKYYELGKEARLFKLESTHKHYDDRFVNVAFYKEIIN